jgi:hypothetical protein
MYGTPQEATLRVRMTVEALAWLTRRAERQGEDRSAWVRRALRFAHEAPMPADWAPGDPMPWERPERARRPAERGDLRAERFVDPA